MTKTTIRVARTKNLDICYEETGAENLCPVILMHGFPDDVRTWDRVVTQLVEKNYRVIVPYLRGYGKTKFLNSEIIRSGQQAALGKDLLDLLDYLKIDKSILVGYDWGGRSACIVSALWPKRVIGLVTVGGYNIQNIPYAQEPSQPEQEMRYWYQWYFCTERGKVGFAKHRREFCKLLWKLWSPNWNFSDEEFERTAESFDNPDFIEVCIHSYRHRYGLVAGDPELEEIERELLKQPLISVPTIDLEPECDGVVPPQDDSKMFSGPYQRKLVPIAGHFLPRETPEEVVWAVGEMQKF